MQANEPLPVIQRDGCPIAAGAAADLYLAARAAFDAESSAGRLTLPTNHEDPGS